MSLAGMMDSTCTIRRPSIGKDSSQGTTQVFDNVVALDMPCSFQESSSSVLDFHNQRQTVNSVSVYFYDDPEATANDQAIVTTTDASGVETVIYLVVEGTATPKANYRLWTLTCRREEAP